MGKTGYKARPVAERFWEKVNKDGPVPAHCPEIGPCWIWTAGINHQRGGYGMFALRKGVIRRSHRIAWELANARPVPEGLMVLHRCDNPPCVRPAHLFTGTGAENVADMIGKGRDTQARGSQRSKKLTEADVAAIRDARSRGVKGKLLAAQYGVTTPTIYQVTRTRWTHVDGALPHVPARGERNGRTKLTDEKVLWIRAQHAGGRDCADIARELGMDRSMIWRAATRRNWTHI